MSLKSVSKLVLRPLPQWAPVGIAPPQQAISVSLDGGGRSLDVTQHQTIASLRPLMVAVGLGGGLAEAAMATLVYRDEASGKELGLVSLRRSAVRSTAAGDIALFAITGAEQRCLSWPRRPWNAWLQARAIRRNTNPHNFQMTPAAVQQLMTFYICPRPVVLVSVSEATHSNVFPMDLIGPLGAGSFTLALRSTSVSVPTMVAARRVVLSGIGAEHKDKVYKLGEHHKKAHADWNGLPFPAVPSETFRIPAIASALWIRELQIEESEPIGSHMFFVCRIVSERQLAKGVQLHHTAGFHQEFRRRRGMPFAPA